MPKIHQILKYITLKLGFKINPLGPSKDMDREFKEIYLLCKKYTMTPVERMYGLYQSINYITKSDIKGDFVECGVWKGGSAMIIALTLLKLGDTSRKIYLYDTFKGMPKPSEKDIRIKDREPAINIWTKSKRNNKYELCFSPLAEVKKNILSTGYPKENIVLVEGKVEETIPRDSPSKIALLRLDTDWYHSTYHTLQHLFPLLNKKGVLLVDDYGYWKGAKDAVDEYLKKNNINILLNKIDPSARIGIK